MTNRAKVLIAGLLISVSMLCQSAAAEDNFMVIVVNSDLQPYIQTSLDQYVYDLEAEGYSVEVKDWDLAGSTPQELKNYLASKQAQGLIGAFFIGDLPIANFYLENDNSGLLPATFPCDLYYMNLGADWTDSDSDGKFDTIIGDRNPQIWLGRLVAGNLSLMGTEEDIINNYFKKVYDYKKGVKKLLCRACTLTLLSYSEQPNPLDRMDNMSIIYDDSEVIYGDSGNFTTVTYGAKLSAGYEFVFLAAHSCPVYHRFHDLEGNDHFRNYRIPEIDPKVWFYNLYACSACDYSYSDYLGGCYISSASYGIIALGSTKPGAMQNFEFFNTPLAEDECFGEAFKSWWIVAVDDGRTEDNIMSCYYGLTLLGDPTLKVKGGLGYTPIPTAIPTPIPTAIPTPIP
ncbi:hypothetical protein KAR10_09265, partial [bacterium]|nr:hypothetical protein [bacterium]